MNFQGLSRTTGNHLFTLVNKVRICNAWADSDSKKKANLRFKVYIYMQPKLNPIFPGLCHSPKRTYEHSNEMSYNRAVIGIHWIHDLKLHKHMSILNINFKY